MATKQDYIDNALNRMTKRTERNCLVLTDKGALSVMALPLGHEDDVYYRVEGEAYRKVHIGIGDTEGNLPVCILKDKPMSVCVAGLRLMVVDFPEGDY